MRRMLFLTTCDCRISRRQFLWWFPRGRVSSSPCISHVGCSQSQAGGSPTFGKGITLISSWNRIKAKLCKPRSYASSKLRLTDQTSHCLVYYIKRQWQGLYQNWRWTTFWRHNSCTLWNWVKAQLSWYANFGSVICMYVLLCVNWIGQQTLIKLTSGFRPLQNCHRAHLQGSWLWELNSKLLCKVNECIKKLFMHYSSKVLTSYSLKAL